MKERCLMELEPKVEKLLQIQLKRIVEDWANVAFGGNIVETELWITHELNIIFDYLGDDEQEGV